MWLLRKKENECKKMRKKQASIGEKSILELKLFEIVFIWFLRKNTIIFKFLGKNILNKDEFSSNKILGRRNKKWIKY